MSIQSMAWSIAQQEERDPIARHILLCLSNYTGVDGTGAFPSTATLARDTGWSERTIRAKLDQLQALGLIRLGLQGLAAVKIDRADRRPVVYDVAIERGAPDAPRKYPVGKSGNSVDKTGDIFGDGVQLTPPRGAPPAPKPRALSVKQQRVDKSPEAKARQRQAEATGLPAAIAALGGLTR